MSLSGGQQQRLCIARALAVEPEILLMDEPASALDPIATAKIEDLIFDLKKDYTVIIVTHNMQQAARVADETAFFYLGKLIEHGEHPRDLRAAQGEAHRELHHREVRIDAPGRRAEGLLRGARAAQRAHHDRWPGRANALSARPSMDSSTRPRRMPRSARARPGDLPVQREIDRECTDLIALHAPVARDLRTIMTTLKITTDLDRIGRGARNIADVALELTVLDPVPPEKLAKLSRNADLAIHMVDQAVRAFVERDDRGVREMGKFDDAVDQLHKEIFADLIVDMDNGSLLPEVGVRFALVNRHIERIADHAVNIAERVVYLVTGQQPPWPEGPAHLDHSEPEPTENSVGGRPSAGPSTDSRPSPGTAPPPSSGGTTRGVGLLPGGRAPGGGQTPSVRGRVPPCAFEGKRSLPSYRHAGRLDPCLAGASTADTARGRAGVPNDGRGHHIVANQFQIV